MAASDRRVNELVAQANDTLLDVMGVNSYMKAMALMVELERLVEPLEVEAAAKALSTFSSLTALRYADRRRHA